MKPKMLKLGTALSVVAAFLNATTAASAGGYDANAALINHYIQSAPWTSYGGGYGGGYGYKHDHGYAHDSHYGHGYGYDHGYGWNNVGYGYAPDYGWGRYPVPTHYVSTPGHSVIAYYDTYGSGAYYGAPAYAKRTTIVHPSVSYAVAPGYGQMAAPMGYDNAAATGDMAQQVKLIRNPIYFASASAQLSPEAKMELDEIGKTVSSYYFADPKVVILLSGFTDATGSPEINEALAKQRIQAVQNYLIAEYGFDVDRFQLRAVGDEIAAASDMPYADNQRKVTVSLLGVAKSAMAEPGQTGLDKGELAPVAEPRQVAQVTRCTVQSGPFAGTVTNGKLLATLFTDIDDYGGGKLEEVCGLGY